MEARSPVEYRSSDGTEAGIEDAFFDNRVKLLVFLKQRGVADGEDVLHDMWLKLRRGVDPARPIVTPLAYLYCMANSIVIDRYHQRQKSERRQMRWLEETETSDMAATPTADRVLQGRETVVRVLALIRAQGDRVYRVFCRHRLDGLTQREVAAEMGVSITTVEGDLRRVYRVLAEFRTADDEV